MLRLSVWVIVLIDDEVPLLVVALLLVEDGEEVVVEADGKIKLLPNKSDIEVIRILKELIFSSFSGN